MTSARVAVRAEAETGLLGPQTGVDTVEVEKLLVAAVLDDAAVAAATKIRSCAHDRCEAMGDVDHGAVLGEPARASR